MVKLKKSPKALRTISEVSKDLNLPQHVLRFWETKFSIIRPLKMGGGRRYYRPEDLIILKNIQNLLHEEGYTIKGVQNIFKKKDKNLKEPLPNIEHKNLPTDQTSELQAIITELEDIRDLIG